MDLVDAALRCRRPNPRFAYLAPTYAQAKDIAWGYLKDYTAPLPEVVQRESDLAVILSSNGARIRLYGADNYDRLRGIYLDGIVIDEVADIDPRAWTEVIRPALSDREGWAVFIGTAKGRDHFYRLYAEAAKDPEWFTMMLRASETGIIPQAELDSARKTMTAERYDQEYECSFDAAVPGAYYALELREADAAKRIDSVPWDRTADVITAWDLGHADKTAIWFAQLVGKEIHVIDYYENSGQAIDHYVREVKSRPYVYSEHLLPHDAQAKELGTGKTIQEVVEALGLRIRVVKRHSVDDGINAVRMALSRCWIDAVKCERGLEALRLYRAEMDEKHQILRSQPLHDWTSHAADALRYLIMGVDESPKIKAWPKPNKSWVV